MRYLKTFEVIKGYYEVEIFTLELNDILQELDDDGYVIDIDSIEWIDDNGIELSGFYVNISTSKKINGEEVFTRDEFLYSDVKHIVEQLISFSKKNGYRVDDVFCECYPKGDGGYIRGLSKLESLENKIDKISIKFFE